MRSRPCASCARRHWPPPCRRAHTHTHAMPYWHCNMALHVCARRRLQLVHTAAPTPHPDRAQLLPLITCCSVGHLGVGLALPAAGGRGQGQGAGGAQGQGGCGAPNHSKIPAAFRGHQGEDACCAPSGGGGGSSSVGVRRRRWPPTPPANLAENLACWPVVGWRCRTSGAGAQPAQPARR